MSDAIRCAQRRHGVSAFAERTSGGSWGWHQTESFPVGEPAQADAYGNHRYGEETPRDFSGLLYGLAVAQ
jgi:hypothetical protein